VKTLENISDHDPSSGAEATSLLDVICTFDFVLNLDEVIVTEFAHKSPRKLNWL